MYHNRMSSMSVSPHEHQALLTLNLPFGLRVNG